jgi:3-methyladenine DNA glycosylase/8-oxoguanine DNA glycosylase
LVQALGRRLPGGPSGGLTHLFPRPKAVAQANLDGLGITGARIRAIRSLAGAVCRGSLSFDAANGTEAFARRLTEIPGVGVWTAQYIAMRACREPDAFPASDLGLRQAAGMDGVPLSAVELERLSESWRPWRSYAAVYLWHGNSLRNRHLEESHVG